MTPFPFPSDGTSNYSYEYHTKMGLVKRKLYREGGSFKYDFDYTYTKLGQLKTRTNARSDTITHNYSTGSQGAETLTSTTYSDGTPTESFYYTRAGRPYRMNDVTGQRDFNFDSGTKSRVQFEELSSFYESKDLEYTWQTGSGVPGRASGVKYGTYNGGTSFTSIYTNGYTFDGTSGRIDGIDAWNSNSGGIRPFRYSYLADSNLIEYIRLGAGDLRRNYWEDWRDLKWAQQSKWGSSIKAQYITSNTYLGQQYRNYMGKFSLSAAYGYPTTTIDTNPIAYNTRGEVTGFTNNVWTNSTFTWDRAGNPTNINRGTGDNISYTANGSNQIEPTGGGIPPEFTYDLDGNLTSDTKNGRTMTYNAKNQLTKITITKAGPTYGDYYEFKYDYMGRRVEKKSVESTTTTTRFVYHGWNLIAEIDVNGSTFTRTKSYHWGLDKSSSLTATGGVESLLMITDHGTGNVYFPVYDTRSNVVALKNLSGSIVEAYAYDPFGKIVFPATPHSNPINPFGYSTKYTDRETGLVYYGHRYFDPITSRWLNRDPIQEAGGLNLYNMAGNDPVNRSDYLGLCYAVIKNVEGTDENGDPSVYPQVIWRDCEDTKKTSQRPTISFNPFSDYEYSSRSNSSQSSGGGNFSHFEGRVAVFTPFVVSDSDNSYWNELRRDRTLQDMDRSGQLGWHPPLVWNSKSHENDSGETVIVVTPGGNALPVPPGGHIGSSPDGGLVDVKGPDGKSTGDQIHGGHPPTSHPDPRGQSPHAHRPGVSTPDGKPWLPVYPEPGVQSSEWTTGEKAAAAGGVVVGGYLIYRGVRMVPSVVFPPLWPTIPVNIAVP